MNHPGTLAVGGSQTSTLATNKVIRNNYTLLFLTAKFRDRTLLI